MKKLLKAGIVGAIACSMIGGTVTLVYMNNGITSSAVFHVYQRRNSSLLGI